MPAEKIVLGEVIQKCLQAYLKLFLPIFVHGLIVFSPLMVLNVVIPEMMSQGSGTLRDTLLLMIPFAFGSFLSAVLTTFILEHLRGGKASLAECLQRGFQRLPLLIALNILLTIAMLAGFLLLIIPGLFLVALFSVAVPAFVVEKASLFGSFQRSAQLTRRAFWPVFALFLLFGVLVMMSTPFLLLIGLVSFENLVLANVGHTLWAILVSGAQSVLTVVIYHELRTKFEGATSEELLEVFS